MSQQAQLTSRSRHVACIVGVAVFSLLGVGSAHAQWASKPAPALPHSILEQGESGSVLLGLVFERNGQVKDVSVLRTSGNPGLDNVALKGAAKWRLDPASLQASDMTTGRRHLIKFFLDANVSRRVEPITASWKEL